MIRPANIDDLESVVEIYNQAIDAGFQSAFIERQSVAERIGWFREHMGSAHPLFVYVIGGNVVGWFSISPYRSGRAALRYTVELSCFIHKDHHRQGLGPQMLVYGINACRQLKYKTAITIILDKNIPSMKLMEKFGFERWGTLPDVADFNGVECSHVYYGIKL